MHVYLQVSTCINLMKARRDVYQAISDPTRREILVLLADRDFSLNEISREFEMSRQAVSLHVQILHECNLVAIEKQGRKRICSVKPDTLWEVHDWVTQFQAFWTQKLRALGKVVDTEQARSNQLKK